MSGRFILHFHTYRNRAKKTCSLLDVLQDDRHDDLLLRFIRLVRFLAKKSCDSYAWFWLSIDMN